MATSLSLSERDSVRKALSGPQLGSQGYPTKVTLHKMAQFSSARYESALNKKNGFVAKVTFIGYPWDPSWGPDNALWTLSRPEREADVAIGFRDLDLMFFHTSRSKIEPTFQI